MVILFFIFALTAAFSLRSGGSNRKIKIDFREAAYLVVYFYLVILFSALGLVWADHWTLPGHLTILALVNVVSWYRLFRNRKNFRCQFMLPKKVLALLLICAAIGVFLQRKSIYYLYATTDPSAYLSAGLRIARTGSFFHHNELSEIAEVKPMLHQFEASNEWMLSRNFGVTPFADSSGRGSFHGLFGAPLFYAIGVKAFKEDGCIHINQIHFIAICILLLGILQALMKRPPNAIEAMALIFFTLCPLISLIFREPLSEPLACVYFLGMLLASLELRRSSSIFFLCILAALCVRVSALMYIPFAVITLLRERPRSKTQWIIGVGLLAIVLMLITRNSPQYVGGTLSAYINIALGKFPGLHRNLLLISAILVPLALLVSVVFKRAPRKLLAWATSSWRWKAVCVLYITGLIGSLAFRYGKLITKLDYYIGGYPFVIYGLDSLLFYASPLLVIIGLGYWFTEFYKNGDSRLKFLQGFVPFIFFFYTAFRFLPLNLQVNFQRYLIIELVPLSILGFVIALSKVKRKALVGLTTLTISWTFGLTAVLNRSDIADTAYVTYQRWQKDLELLKDKQKNPVLVGVNLRWLELAFITPLSNAFGYPIAFVDESFSNRSVRGLDALIKAGYDPVLIFSEKFSSQEKIEVAGYEWNSFKKWHDCIHYSKMNLSAPPVELDNLCTTLALYTRTNKQILANDAPLWRPAFYYRSQNNLRSATHWYGIEINGRKLCENDVEYTAHISLLFSPTEDFASPKAYWRDQFVELNKITSLSGNRFKSHLVELTTRLEAVDCNAWNQLDIFFMPEPAFSRPRQAVVQDVWVKPSFEVPGQLAFNTQ